MTNNVCLDILQFATPAGAELCAQLIFKLIQSHDSERIIYSPTRNAFGVMRKIVFPSRFYNSFHCNVLPAHNAYAYVRRLNDFAANSCKDVYC